MNLLKRLSAYTLLNFLQQGVNFLLVPIYTHYLNPDAYGTLNLITTYVAVGGTALFLGLEGSISREYFSTRALRYSVYVGNVLLIPTVLCAAYTLAAVLAADALAPEMGVGAGWIIALPALSLGSRLPEVLLFTLRNGERAKEFMLYSLVFFGIEVSLSVLLVTQWAMGWEGRMWGLAARFLLGSALAVLVLHRMGYLRVVFNWPRLGRDVRQALAFSLPLIPHLLSKDIVAYANRFFIVGMETRADLGVYNIGLQLGTVLNILSSSFMVAYTPWLFHRLKEGAAQNRLAIRKVGLLYRAAMVVTFLAIWLLSPLYFNWFVSDAYSGGSVYVFWVCLGYLLWAFYLVEVNYLFYYRRTDLLGILGIATAALNITLNYVFILYFGTIGAAYAAVVSYAVVLVCVSFLSRNVQRQHTAT